jgi:acyl-CoA reductase-like NAD-dependent aldehyde dehydrogenase
MAVATEREYGLFIDGELREPESGEVRELTEPASGEPLAKAAMAGEADIDRAVEAARAALDGAWAKTPATERSRLLHALADAIVANRKELAELEARNVGKAISSVKGELARRTSASTPRRSPRSPAARTRSAARCSSTRSRSPSGSAARSCRGTTRS